MPLALPPTHERTFASLVTEARGRIPRLAPGWTDHNAHDPGITLIELFAHLTEIDLYRSSRVTNAQRRSFLRWFGVDAVGPTVAETVVALGIPGNAPPAAAPVHVEADREVTSAGRDVPFSTIAPLTVQAAAMTGLFAGARQICAADPAAVALVLDTPAAVLGARGQEAFVIALDKAVAGDVTLYLWTGAGDHDSEVRGRLIEEAAARQIDRRDALSPCPVSRLDDWRRHHDVDLVWEAGTATGWVPLSRVDDRTRALTLSGFVRLRVDVALDPVDLGGGRRSFAIRARAIRGSYERPPALRGVLLNAVRVRHQSRRFRVRLGTSNGCAGQEWQVPRDVNTPAPGMPLVYDRTAVFTAKAGARPLNWTVAPNWDHAGPDDLTAVLEPETGTVRFGNGRYGRVPPAGAIIRLLARAGGGAAGNVPARTLATLALDRAATRLLDVVQPFPARGGGPAPAIADLQAHMISTLARPTRAATLADFQQLALDTPGLPHGGAYAIPDHHPAFTRLPAPGCVTVVVVPRGTGSMPVPTRGFLAAVRAYLGRRRPVGVELHVIGPTYTVVAVRARLHLGPDARADTVTRAASTALDAFFHPLTGGPDGRGWPVGRDVYRSEVLALLQSVPGVHHVDELSLLVGTDREARCQNVSVCPTHLVATGKHDLTVAPARIR